MSRDYRFSSARLPRMKRAERFSGLGVVPLPVAPMPGVRLDLGPGQTDSAEDAAMWALDQQAMLTFIDGRKCVDSDGHVTQWTTPDACRGRVGQIDSSCKWGFYKIGASCSPENLANFMVQAPRYTWAQRKIRALLDAAPDHSTGYHVADADRWASWCWEMAQLLSVLDWSCGIHPAYGGLLAHVSGMQAGGDLNIQSGRRVQAWVATMDSTLTRWRGSVSPPRIQGIAPSMLGVRQVAMPFALNGATPSTVPVPSGKGSFDPIDGWTPSELWNMADHGTCHGQDWHVEIRVVNGRFRGDEGASMSSPTGSPAWIYNEDRSSPDHGCRFGSLVPYPWPVVNELLYEMRPDSLGFVHRVPSRQQDQNPTSFDRWRTWCRATIGLGYWYTYHWSKSGFTVDYSYGTALATATMLEAMALDALDISQGEMLQAAFDSWQARIQELPEAARDAFNGGVPAAEMTRQRANLAFETNRAGAMAVSNMVGAVGGAYGALASAASNALVDLLKGLLGVATGAIPCPAPPFVRLFPPEAGAACSQDPTQWDLPDQSTQQPVQGSSVGKWILAGAAAIAIGGAAWAALAPKKR